MPKAKIIAPIAAALAAAAILTAALAQQAPEHCATTSPSQPEPIRSAYPATPQAGSGFNAYGELADFSALNAPAPKPDPACE